MSSMMCIMIFEINHLGGVYALIAIVAVFMISLPSVCDAVMIH